MRRIRFFALALISFVTALIGAFLAPGTFLHRVLSVATCTVFSFNSTLCAANLARSGDHVVAANPPAVVVQGNACASETVTQPTMQRGYDGTMYQSYYDFRRGQEKINPAACGREYSISPNPKHPLYGIRFVYLVNGQRNRVVPTLYYETASGELKVWDNNVAAARLPNPFSPDLGIASNPNPTRSQVDRPNSSQPTQPQPNSDSLAGIWLYNLYDSSSANKSILKIPIKVKQDTNQLLVSECTDICDKIPIPRSYFVLRNPQDDSVVMNDGNISLETVESQDGQAIWGVLSDRESGKAIYFAAEKISSLVALSSTEQMKSGEFVFTKNVTLEKTSIYSLAFSHKNSPQTREENRSYQVAFNPSCISSLLQQQTQRASELVKNFAKFQQEVNKVSPQAERLVGQKVAVDEFSRKAAIEYRWLLDYWSKFKATSKASIKSLNSCIDLKDLKNLGLRAGTLLAQATLIAVTAAVAEWCIKNPEGCKQLARNPGATARAIGEELKNLIKGTSYGDPHMITFDGFKYSFQTVGEFTLVKSTDGNFEVQARQGAISNSVSMNTAVAMKIGNSRVALYAKNPPDSDTSTPLRVDGKPTKLENGTLELPGGGKIQGNSSYYLVTAPTGEQVGVNIDSGRMDIKPYISGQSGQYIGLLGNANGDSADDLRTRGGKVIPIKENSTYGQVSQALRNVLPVPAPLNQAEKIFFDVVYKEFGDSWRISQAESLFDYPPGKDTGTFTNRSFPNSYLSLNSLLPPQIRQAEEICRQAGVESELMDGCIFDVGHTGDASFAQSAANALLDTAKDRLLQELGNKVPVPPLPVPVRIPGIRF